MFKTHLIVTLLTGKVEENWDGDRDQHDEGSWWLDDDGGPGAAAKSLELLMRTADASERSHRCRFLNGVTNFFCWSAIHTRNLGQRWFARWLPQFGIKVDVNGKILPNHKSLPKRFSWALYFAQSCTSNSRVCPGRGA